MNDCRASNEQNLGLPLDDFSCSVALIASVQQLLSPPTLNEEKKQGYMVFIARSLSF